MNHNRVSPFESKIDGFQNEFNDSLQPVNGVQLKEADKNHNVNIPIRKNPIIENAKYSELRKARREQRAKNKKEKEESTDETADIRLLIENKRVPGQWTPYLHERRDKLFEKPVEPSVGCCGHGKSNKHNWRRFKAWQKEMKYKLEPWGSWLRKVEGHQGTGVVSYFVFLRWLLFLNCGLFLLMFLFITLPFVAFPSDGYTYAVTGNSVSGVDSSSPATCTPLYEVNVSSSAATLIQDFLQGSGWMEKTAMFYGYYDAVELNMGTSGGHKFNYLMPLAYFLVSIIILLISLITMSRYTMKSFRENLHDQNEKHQYCNRVFGGWDFALSQDGSAELKHKSIYKDMVGELAEQRYYESRKQMTGEEKCKMWSLRVLVNFLVICMLGGSGFLIYWVTDWVTHFLNTYDKDSYDNFVILLIEFLPSLTITALNGIVPLIFGLVVKLENYTPEFTIKITLIRTVFLRLASLAVLIATIYQNVTCSTKDTTCNVGYDTCDSLRCWETYVGQNFYKLIVTDFIVHIGVTLGYELPRKLFTTKCNASICKKVGPAEFDIPKNVLDIVYTQTLCWLGFFYAPLTPVLATISLFVLFFLKYLSAMYNTVPPEVPYKASKSNNFFMIVLMCAFFLCCLPVGYTMVKITPSKGCGPFRIYSYMTTSIDTTVSNFPDWLNTMYGMVTSGAFVLTILVVLSLAIYYNASKSSARAEMIVMLKEQMIMEGKDKQFLMNRIYELTGEKPGTKKPNSQPPPYVKPADVKTVNEVNNRQNGNVPADSDIKAEKKENVPPPAPYDSPDQKTAETSLNREITNVDWDGDGTVSNRTGAKSTATTSKVGFDF